MQKLNNLRKQLSTALSVGWFLSLRQIRRSGKGTTALIIFIMVLTFLNLVVVSGLLIGLISGSYQQFKESYSGDVIVTPLSGRDMIEKSPEIISFIENHPKVETFTSRYGLGVQILGSLTTLPKKNERTNEINARLSGIDPETEEQVTAFSRFIIKGESLNAEDRNSILIGSNLLKQYSSFADANIPGLELMEDVDVGSRVRVSYMTKSGESVIKEYVVKGIVKSKVDEISTRAFVIDKEVKSFIPVNKENYQEIAIKIPTDYAPYLVQELKNSYGEFARFQTSEEAIPSFLRDIEATMTILGNALSSFALVVAAITVFIVVFINAVTKRKFIGVMKGIGISPLAIEFSYICQAFFYGIVGSALGLLLTFGVLKPYFDAYPINFPFSDGILVATASGSLLRVAILLVITVLAGYIPAKLIVRKNTLDSILGR
jgi:ABC-type lipoprotein release transport system permease subunit